MSCVYYDNIQMELNPFAFLYNIPDLTKHNLLSPTAGAFLPTCSLGSPILPEHNLILSLLRLVRPDMIKQMLLRGTHVFLFLSGFQGNQLCERSRIWRVNDMSAMLTVVQLPDELVEEEQQTANIRYLNGLLGNRLGITTILAMTSIESRLANIFELLDGILMSLPNKQHMTSWWDRLVLVFNQGENRLDRVMQQRETMVNHILPDIQRRYGLSRAPSIVFVSTKTYEEMQQRSNISAEQYRTTCQQMLWRIVSGHSTQGWWRGDAVVPEEARSTDASIGSDSSDDDINGMVVMLGPKQDKRKQTSTPIKRRFTKRWVATPSHHGP
ncbi:hypothetical protein DFQ28_000082 [Apophysomyces sp. BC1034]|nr:hypothetical protein DFQ29_008571 [Apophysomyces sp. BC1021]KAG0194384.1 hypothetical protein DFQ28_000082 [Apophysomyces sp. BC1034]